MFGEVFLHKLDRVCRCGVAMNLLRTMLTFSWSCTGNCVSLILSNNNAGLHFSLEQHIHGAQYLLNLVLVF